MGLEPALMLLLFIGNPSKILYKFLTNFQRVPDGFPSTWGSKLPNTKKNISTIYVCITQMV